MPKYEVLRDCYGFQKRYWRRGDIVEIAEGENPPHHFKRLDGEPVQAPQSSDEKMALSQMAVQTKIPPTGMAAGFDPNPETPMTAGKAFKKGKSKH